MLISLSVNLLIIGLIDLFITWSNEMSESDEKMHHSFQEPKFLFFDEQSKTQNCLVCQKREKQKVLTFVEQEPEKVLG